MSRAPAGDAAGALALPLVPVLAVWNNLVVPRLPGGRWPYVLANTAATGALLAAARSTGLTWDDVGLGRQRLPAGARSGGRWFAAVSGAYAMGLAVPSLRPLLADARIAGLEGGEVAFRALVGVPFGTVLWEEVAFRGVLPATLRRLGSPTAATAGSAALFGIWHIRPTLDQLAANGLARGTARRAIAVLGACLATAGAGVLFDRLRTRSGSLLAPVLLHLATNTLGTAAASAAHRLGRAPTRASGTG